MKRRLGVNIDHIATLREARKVRYPDPYEALPVLTLCGVEQVTIHLREDRRHIQDHDLKRITAAAALPVNLELAVTDAMVKIALKAKPHTATFVPEKRQEVTTEGGLDCVRQAKAVGRAIDRLKAKGVRVSLFIDPDPRQTAMAARLGADAIEFHTGTYCHLVENYRDRYGSYDVQAGTALSRRIERSLSALGEACAQAETLGLKVFAGHGLHVENLSPVVAIPQIEEYNIGHAIIARAVFVGLETAIREIQAVLNPPS